MTLQRNYYTNQFLDEDFEDTVLYKEKQVKEKYNEKSLKDLYFDDAVKINKALVSEDTTNRYYRGINRENKRLMLEYLDKCLKEDLSNLPYKEKIEFKGTYISEVTSKLGHLGFRSKDFSPFFIVAGLALDLLLIVFGIAKYYYYIPIFFIWITYKQIKGLIKAKKEGKLLRW
jgi:hypothetical protein